MKIVLAISDKKGKTVLYVTDDLKVYSVSEAVALTQKGQFEGLYVATRGGASYVRARASSSSPKIDSLTIAAKNIVQFTTVALFPASRLRFFYDACRKFYAEEIQQGEVIKAVDTNQFASKEYVRNRLIENKSYIFEASEQQHINPDLLGAILIDEIMRLALFEEIRDRIVGQWLPINVSIGVGEIKVETARQIIKEGLYNPNPRDELLSASKISRTSSRHIASYVALPRNNIFFAAAQVHHLTLLWQKKASIIIAPEIIATLYSIGDGMPKLNPQPSPRGKQIIDEFYPLAKIWLGER